MNFFAILDSFGTANDNSPVVKNYIIKPAGLIKIRKRSCSFSKSSDKNENHGTKMKNSDKIEKQGRLVNPNRRFVFRYLLVIFVFIVSLKVI